ncbi:MAG: HD family hydrolase [Promethearchaeota archaeon]
MEYLKSQINFIIELDKLKEVYRQTYVINTDRKENSAEHSWHLALMAILLNGYSNEPIDLFHVLKMLLIHDIVEIDTGDTFCYDKTEDLDRMEGERKAANRIFTLLPDNQAKEFQDLWNEFEDRITAEARFAAALDRIMPLLHNYYTQGKSWQEHGITSDQVLARNRYIDDGSKFLWHYARTLIHDAVKKQYLQTRDNRFRT